VEIAVAGSSGLGAVIGVSTEPTALLAALPAARPRHLLVLAPRHLERSAREQAHVVVAAHPEVRVGVLPFDHHALTLTLIGAAVLELRGTPTGWSEAGEAVQLVQQSAARSRSIVWHPRVLGLHRPVPSVAQSAASLFRAGGYFVELGTGGGPTRGARGYAPDGDEGLYVAGEAPPLLLSQLGETAPQVVALSPEGSAPYLTRGSVELCGLAGPSWAPLAERTCDVFATGRPPSGCVFCGTGEAATRPDSRTGPPAAVPVP